MEKFLPLFPLNLVAFPNEALNLHIFEPRYKQLIKDVIATSQPFGVPSYVHKKIEYGTEMEVIKIDKEYEDGRLDIMTLGRRVFKVEEYINPLPEKQYAGGKVLFLEQDEITDYRVQTEMLHWVKKLYEALKLADIQVPEELSSFEIAHKIGLSQEDEYELLQINNELDRQHFIINHLKKAVPMIQNIEKTKYRIQMNGHFKSLDPLNF
ncbi:MAG: LON peptidase substrate-binding domain-containing protein [Bacteroidota bacterium]|nr:LON peptidase substrate-binding domain-containing protein [Bacteroidota bacterium]